MIAYSLIVKAGYLEVTANRLMHANEICDEVARSFWLESIKRQVHNIDDVEGLREICIALLHSNNSLKTMLQQLMWERLDG